MGGAQAFGIGLEIDELQWVKGADRRPTLAKGALVGELADALPGADTKMMTTERTHHEGGAQVDKARVSPTGGTLPLRLGRLAGATLDLDDDIH